MAHAEPRQSYGAGLARPNIGGVDRASVAWTGPTGLVGALVCPTLVANVRPTPDGRGVA